MTARPPTFAPVRAGANAFKPAAAERESAAARGYDRKWRFVRAKFLRAHPNCACGAAATDVDHVLPLASGGTHAWSNLRALCRPCHSRKTATVDGGFGNAKKSLGAGVVDRVGTHARASTKLVF